ncbi:MAG: ABC transporter substrate-binding protein [Treponema sp.]|jgi:NitT/TauT family transport system substrate-binding protein|nr:ABC transporter substrate-binding protein [Treponema sp.]
MKMMLWLFLLPAVLSAPLWGRGGGEKKLQNNADGTAKLSPAKKILVLDADPDSSAHLNLYVAYEKGLFKKRGLEVEIQGSVSGLTLVVSGKADILFGCPSGVVSAIARGANVAMIGQVTLPCSSTLIVPVDSSYRKPVDLDAQMIAGLSPICCAVVSIRNTLQTQYDTDFRLVALEPEAALAALGAGQVQGAIFEEPFVSLALLKKDAAGKLLYRALFDGSSDADGDGEIEPSLAGPKAPCHAITAGRNFIAARPDEAKAFIEAIDEANSLILREPGAEDIADITVKHTGFDREAVIASAPRMGFTIQLGVEEFKAYAGLLARQGSIERDPGDDLFAPEFKGITW